MTSAWPRPGYAWYMTVLLTVAYVLSFVDIYILALLVQPLKAGLALSDTQVGVLLGPAFAALYAALGLPLGWLADRRRRTVLVAAGVAVWSLATAACGLAGSFGELALARVVVGLGDAALAPCALSLISDSFPPERRGRPVAFYVTAQSVGAGIAALAGGSVMAWAGGRAGLELPLVGTVAPWQFAFVAVGLPGLVVAALLALLREPGRQEAGDGVGMRETLAWLAGRRTTYAPLIAVTCVMTIVAYSQNWYPAVFQRTWGWDVGRFAFMSGAALVVMGPLVVNLAGWLCDRLVAAGRADGPQRLVVAGTWLLVPTAVAVPLMPTGEAALALWLVNLAGLSTVSAAAPVALLDATPGPMRAQFTALFYMVITLTGLVVGPLSVGLLTDHVFGEAAVRWSCSAVAVVVGAAGLVLVRRLTPSYASPRAASQARASSASSSNQRRAEPSRKV